MLSVRNSNRRGNFGAALRLVLLLVISAFACPLLLTQTSTVTNLQVGHDTWTFKEGAPEKVYALAQTTDGFLWLGTPTGLFRFDGIRFERFSSPFGDQLLSTSIASLFAPESGGLWVGYPSGGVSFLNNGRMKTYIDASPDARVLGFAQDVEGAIWLATSGGLWRFDHSRWQHLGAEWNAPTGPVHPMAFDRDGTLWAIYVTKLLYLRPGSKQFHIAEQNLPAPEFTVDADGKVVTSPAQGRVTPNTNGNPRETLPAYPVLRSESGQLMDRTNSLWVSSADPVIIRLAPTERSYNTANKLTRSKFETYDINAFWDAKLVDREGNIWFGDQHGIHRFFYSPLIKQQMPKGAIDNFVVAPDDQGAVWIGSLDSPLYRISKADATLVLHSATSSLYRGPDRTFWFGGSSWEQSPGSLFHLIGHNLSRVKLPRELEPMATLVRAITADRLGRIWVSFSPGGLYRLTNGVWTPLGGRTDFPKTDVMSEFTDSLGRVWFGSSKNRLADLDGERLQVFSSEDGIQVGNVTAISGRGTEIWIGGEFGLQHFDGTRFHNINAANQEWLRGISGIVETADGDLWLNGLSGILHIRRTELVEAIRDPIYRVTGEHYGRRAGVPGIAAQMYSLPTAVEGTDGRLWFALSAGVVWLDPAHSESGVFSPPISIQLVSVDDKSYEPVFPLKLPARSSNVQITFAAVSLSDPETLRFRYKLQETDKDWREVAAANPVSYRNLSPGSYHFVVAAANTNGVWPDKVATAEFTILPAFYQTRWFLVLCIAAALGALYLVYLLRVRQVAHQFRVRMDERVNERTRIARELHDTILQSFQGLLLVLQSGINLLPDRPDVARARERLQGAIDQADQAITEGRDAVQGLRSSTMVSGDFAAALNTLGADLAAVGGNQSPPTFHVEVEGKARELKPVLRDEIYRIAGEALRNAFRHAQASRIEVTIRYDEQQLTVRVRDDGKGIGLETLEAKGRAGHWGLPGMRERASKIGAQLELWSRPEAGTEMELKIPAATAYQSRRAWGNWFSPRRSSDIDTQS